MSSTRDAEKYQIALARQMAERGPVKHSPINPRRITMALDLRNLHGPAVDAALGVPEPTVDQWEAGELVPTAWDVRRLAALTGFPVLWFHLADTRVVDPGSVFVCTSLSLW
jgi:DNA-binding transcriptional regulator YiaG